MRDRLIDILMNVHVPIMDEDTEVGTYKIAQIAAEKCADALIENGISVPTFTIGDIVWVYDFMWGILPCEVDRPYHCRCGKEGVCTFEMNFSEADIGDLVFATKEEAEIYWHEKGRKK